MTAGDVMRRASTELNDVDRVRWTAPMLLDFGNDAARQTALLRPDLAAKRLTRKLEAGAMQVLPVGAFQLLDCPARLAGPDGPRISGLRRVERAALEAMGSGWLAAAQPGAYAGPRVFACDERTPAVFWVHPGPPETGPGVPEVWIELLAAVTPAPAVAETDPVDLPEVCLGPVLHWTLYRAFAVDSLSRENRERALFNHQAFYQSLARLPDRQD